MVVNMIKVTLSGCKIHFFPFSTWCICIELQFLGCGLLPRMPPNCSYYPGGDPRPGPGEARAMVLGEAHGVCVPLATRLLLPRALRDLETPHSGQAWRGHGRRDEWGTWGPRWPSLHPSSAQQLAPVSHSSLSPSAPHPRSPAFRDRVSLSSWLSERGGCCLWTPEQSRRGPFHPTRPGLNVQIPTTSYVRAHKGQTSGLRQQPGSCLPSLEHSLESSSHLDSASPTIQ